MWQSAKQSLFEAVRQFLQEAGIAFGCDEEQGYFVFDVDDKFLRWRMSVVINPDHQKQTLRFEASLQIKVPASNRPIMSELFSVMNEDVDIGLWDLAMHNGGTWYGLNVNLPAGELTKPLFMKMMDISLNMNVVANYPAMSDCAMYERVSSTQVQWQEWVQQQEDSFV